MMRQIFVFISVLLKHKLVLLSLDQMSTSSYLIPVYKIG